jgi:oxygen-dependent protoporphyrinogen oxidase
VVVIGGSIAGLCAADRAADRGADVTLLEAGPRVGGKLAHRTGGRGSSSKPALTRCWSSSRRRAHSWMRWVCGGGRPARAAIAGETTFNVLHRGELLPVPDGLAGVVPTRLWPMLATRLLSLVGRARMAREIAVPRRAGKDDQPLGMFITRRLGRQTFERLVEPLVAGMHPGTVPL